MGAEPKLDLRVLVVDDEPDARELLALVLEREVREVEVAASASEAFARVLADAPDMILSDISMPGEDGWSLVRRVRALPRGRAMPIGAVTANAMPADIARSRAAGFDFVLAKPVAPKSLVDAVRVAVDAYIAVPAPEHPLARRVRLASVAGRTRIGSARGRRDPSRAAIQRSHGIAVATMRLLAAAHDRLGTRR
ncbi:MAG TPA: response regulator [Labilithrix sp.]